MLTFFKMKIVNLCSFEMSFFLVKYRFSKSENYCNFGALLFYLCPLLAFVSFLLLCPFVVCLLLHKKDLRLKNYSEY